MAQLPMNLIERMVVTKVSRGGYTIEAMTMRGTKVEYYPSLKGVIADLYRMFEGKEKLNKDQLTVFSGKTVK